MYSPDDGTVAPNT